MKTVGKHHRRPIVYAQLSRDEHHDAFIDAGLRVNSRNLMFHIANACQLFEYGLLAHELLSFKGQHRLVRKQVHQLLRNTNVNGVNSLYLPLWIG